MASGSWEFSTANKYITGRIEWSSRSNGSSANTSIVTVTLKYKKSSSSTSSTYGSGSFYITIAGSRKNFSGRYTFSCNNSWQTIGSHSYTVGHNSDGSGSCYIGAGGGIPSTSFSSSSTSKTVGLDKIPRYANIKTFKCTATTQTSATFSWSTDVTCKEVWGYVGNTSKYHATISATSGSFTISNLSPNTSYSIKLQVKRSDSGLNSTSSITIKTLPIATISSCINFNIGEDLTLTFLNYDKNESYLKLCVLNDEGIWENDIATTTSAKGEETFVWTLSSISTLLFSKCKTKNSTSIKIICGVTLNGTNYENITQGTISVVNSNPTFSSFTLKNTNENISTLLGTDKYLISGYGNLKIIISNTSKAIALNEAFIKEYLVKINNNNLNYNKTIQYSETEDVSIDFGSFPNSGIYTIKINAVDSRGNVSEIIEDTFTVLPYSPPSISPTVSRLNNFEKEILLSITGYCSKITLNDVVKNKNIIIKYRKFSHSTTTYSEYTELDYSKENQANTDNYILSKVINSEPYFDNIPSNEMWDYEFIISDAITQSSPIIVAVDQGVPLATLVDDGKFLIGLTQNEAEENDVDSLLQVNSDINAKDENGNHVRLLKRVNELIIDSSEEPVSQFIGGYWLKSSMIE